MDLGVIPTDNLYKFLAISGLVLVIFSFVFANKLISRLRERLFEVQVDVAKINAELDFLESQQGASPDLGGGTPVSDPLHSQREQKVALAVADIKMEQLEFLIRETRIATKGLILGVGIGGAMMVAGFTLWYEKLQKPLDQEIQMKEVSQPNRALKSDGQPATRLVRRLA